MNELTERPYMELDGIRVTGVGIDTEVTMKWHIMQQPQMPLRSMSVSFTYAEGKQPLASVLALKDKQRVEITLAPDGWGTGNEFSRGMYLVKGIPEVTTNEFGETVVTVPFYHDTPGMTLW